MARLPGGQNLKHTSTIAYRLWWTFQLSRSAGKGGCHAQLQHGHEGRRGGPLGRHRGGGVRHRRHDLRGLPDRGDAGARCQHHHGRRVGRHRDGGDHPPLPHGVGEDRGHPGEDLGVTQRAGQCPATTQPLGPKGPSGLFASRSVMLNPRSAGEG